MIEMCTAKSLRDQHLDRLAHELIRRIPKDVHDAVAGELDHPLIVDHEHGVRTRRQDALEFRFGRMQIGSRLGRAPVAGAQVAQSLPEPEPERSSESSDCPAVVFAVWLSQASPTIRTMVMRSRVTCFVCNDLDQ